MERLYPGCNSLQINATLKELRLAEGVTCSEFFLLIYCDKFQLRITPTAKRNSVRVAAAYGHLYHVPAPLALIMDTSPATSTIPALPKGKENIQTDLNTTSMSSLLW